MNEKKTESAITLQLPSNYFFDVTFAKELYSNLAVDLRNTEDVDKKIRIWEKDCFINENGYPAYHLNEDGTIGHDMLVIYDGCVAGGWQSEMPDVNINIDEDDFSQIYKKTMSDPGVLATIENGSKYRFDIINEVCIKASIRAKAINIRDYTSLTLFEEDTVKLYYTLRAIQDFISKGRATILDTCSNELLHILSFPKEKLQSLYLSSNYDIVKQFEQFDEGFLEFIGEIRNFAKTTKSNKLEVLIDNLRCKDKRLLDKRRLLLKRIVNDWYDISSLNTEELNSLEEVINMIDKKLPEKYEQLSRVN